jgi:hypothetical protein
LGCFVYHWVVVVYFDCCHCIEILKIYKYEKGESQLRQIVIVSLS